jgi:hypothetical protein
VADGETFDSVDVAEAEALDARIDDVLAGRPERTVEPEVLWLATAMRSDPPPSLAQRVRTRGERALRRQWLPVRIAAAAMAYLYISQGIGNLAFGDWVARGVGDDYSPHLTREGGFALIAVGIAVLAGVVSRQMLPVSVVAGVPLALVFGIAGITEIGVFAAGAVLHITQGVVGVILAVTFWQYRRYTSAAPDE